MAAVAAPAPATFAGRAMGSVLRAIVVGASPRLANVAWHRLTREMEAAEDDLTRFRPDSALSLLNAAAGDGEWHAVRPRLRTMLALAARAWRATDGRFDARVIRHLEAIGEHAGVPLPSAPMEGIAGARAMDPGIERRSRANAVRIGAPVDSGGIGKGLGLRWASRAGCAALPPGAGLLIEAGGDIVASGPAPGGGSWRIAIEDPAGEEPLAVVEIGGGAIATSSTAVRRWTDADGRPVHHLIDPRTGEPGDAGLVAVTVAHADPAWAEVWSKAMFLAGAGAIGPEARARGFAAWWVRDDGTLEMTPSARQRTIWQRPTRGQTPD